MTCSFHNFDFELCNCTQQFAWSKLKRNRYRNCPSQNLFLSGNYLMEMVVFYFHQPRGPKRFDLEYCNKNSRRSGRGDGALIAICRRFRYVLYIRLRTTEYLKLLVAVQIVASQTCYETTGEVWPLSTWSMWKQIEGGLRSAYLPTRP